MKQYYVYILASRIRGYLYTGVTNNLGRRGFEHKSEFVNSYTKRHNIKTLVYYEILEDVNEAIHREKIVKKWKREYKFDAIEKMNPKWEDLYYILNE